MLGKQAAARAEFAELEELVWDQASEYFSKRGYEVETVDRPILIHGDRCGGLQMAGVFLTTSDGFGYAYKACFVSGTWYLEGPLFAD